MEMKELRAQSSEKGRKRCLHVPDPVLVLVLPLLTMKVTTTGESQHRCTMKVLIMLLLIV
jgi:hypothetical protein